jgi:hypothetical protein
MPFEIACTYQPTAFGLIFLPPDTDGAYECDLRVSFEPLAYYPAEPDVGAGADFDARITSVEMLDGRDDTNEDGTPCQTPWRTLEGDARKAAEAFLDAHCRDDMWAEAEAETTAAYVDLVYRRAA